MGSGKCWDLQVGGSCFCGFGREVGRAQAHIRGILNIFTEWFPGQWDPCAFLKIVVVVTPCSLALWLVEHEVVGRAGFPEIYLQGHCTDAQRFLL